MRDILFRSKRIDDSKWIYGGVFYCKNKIQCGTDGKPSNTFLVEFPEDLCINSFSYGDAFYTNEQFIQVDPETVCQFTGICDKNNKKIFEGDIVKQFITYHATNEDEFKTRIGYIAFLQQECGFSLILPNSDVRIGHRNTGSGYAVDINMEIIGNIYDNPELIS